eukprot:CAMPEP_0119039350 /NCGR_PEP_ID=MMETSP1177-20130426/8767_1 /TAXON_ID=2985 /ORGANISM="Ochromonas sp, Strain CCMP1899" /LENGTH=382 /DNA_ID=CAMNT_0007003081 /DNA_START=237 /DNA_END=1382 /DNA_ORIENTATION=+
MAIDKVSGIVFASLNDGSVVSISQEGMLIGPVFFVGGYIASDVKTNGLEGHQEKMSWCKGEARAHRLAWNPEGEKSCGRPLGMRILDNKLYILDAYHGLFSLDLLSNTAEHLISSSTIINIGNKDRGLVDPTALLPPKFFNDLDIIDRTTQAGEERIVHFSDTSYKNTRSENRQEILDGAPRGRLFSFNIDRKELTVLACGLHFPNGVQILNDREILLAESTRFRVLKIDVQSLLNEDPESALLQSCTEHGSVWTYLNTTKGNEVPNPVVSVFLDRVPGFMDNIRLDSKTSLSDSPNFFIGIGTKSSQPLSILHYLYQTNILRELIGRFFPMKYVEKLVPKYGMLIQIDAKGEVLETLHDTKGEKMVMISEAQRHPLTGDIW